MNFSRILIATRSIRINPIIINGKRFKSDKIIDNKEFLDLIDDTVINNESNVISEQSKHRVSDVRKELKRRDKSLRVLDDFVDDQLHLASVLKQPRYDFLDAMLEDRKYRHSHELEQSYIPGYEPEDRLKSLTDTPTAAELEEEERDEEDSRARFESQKCRFCGSDEKSQLDSIMHPLNPGIMVRLLSGYGTIRARSNTGLCAKHQRRFNRIVRRARHLGVLSHKQRTFTIHGPFADTPFTRSFEGQWMGGRNAGDNEEVHDMIELEEDEAEYDDSNVPTTAQQLAAGVELARAETRLAEKAADEDMEK